MVNPSAQNTLKRKFPPMGEVSKSLKIHWYRCPIDKYVLKELMKPNNLKGFFYSLGGLFIWFLLGILTFYFFSMKIWWAFCFFLFFTGTVASHFNAPQHELCHKTVFKTKWLNDCFLVIYSLIAPFNFRIYQFSHTYHHRFTLFVEGDREEVMPENPSLRFLYLLQLFTINIFGGYQSTGIIPTLANFFNIALNRFDNPFLFWGSELYDGYPDHRKQAVNWARFVLIFHFGFFLVCLYFNQPIISLIFSGSSFIGGAHRYFVGVPMHCGLKPNVNDFRKCTRTIILDPFSEFLYWNMNWHLEHHMYAGVPHYNLKKLHQAVSKDMPTPRTLVGAWREMRNTWKKQKKDPDYAYDTPVPKIKSENDMITDVNSMSIGGLDPRNN